MILDEPTASLDPVAENQMYASLTEMMKGRSCILTSHRLAARYADWILVLQGGRLIQDETHHSLMEEGGVYASMYLAQSHWYDSGKATKL